MIKTAKSLVKALYIALGVFLFLFVFFHIGGSLYVSYIARESRSLFTGGIKQDFAHLREQGNIVAKNSLVQKYLLEQNTEKLSEVLQNEKNLRSIGLMGVVNSEGINIARTRTPGKHGDNVFILNPVGRRVAQGEYAESIEIPIGFSPDQLFLNTGRPVMHDGHMIGALFANYLTDDVYATRFRDTYLPHGVEVVFYNKDTGVYGSSFSNNEIHKLTHSYFNSTSDWVKNGKTGSTIAFVDGSFYLVENVIFPGLEQSPGGALIFIPRHDFSAVSNVLLSMFTLCTFLFFALRYHSHSRGEERGWRYYLIICIVSIPVFIIAFFALHLENIGYLKLQRTPYALYNSTLRVEPEFGVYDLDFEQRFSIIVDTGDESINAVDIELQYNSALAYISRIEISTSTCMYVIENKIKRVEGKASVSCVLWPLQTGQQSQNIADVVIVPKRTGTFILGFDMDNTKVLANDGLGTNVLRTAQSGSYQIGTFDRSIATTTKTILVFSPTHPNQSRWYNTNVVQLVWVGKPNTVYVYNLDTSPDTIPSGKNTTQDSSIRMDIPGDGIFYFHLRDVSGGPVTHYKIQSDHTPPSIISMHLSSDNIVQGDVVRFSFEARDIGSGVQQNYYVDLGNHLFLPTGSQLFIPFLESGDKNIILRVYDSAGNYSEKSQQIHVRDL